MANNSQKISSLIQRLDKRIIDLATRNHINVTMRIDEELPFLRRCLEIAQDDQSSRKFDITESKTGSCTITYTADGESVSAGSNVLLYGDTLVITVTASTGSTITSLKVNGKDYESGTAITVKDDISVVVVSTLNTYDLTVTPAEHTSISVTKGGTPISAGEDVLTYGDSIVISASAEEGYMITSLEINGTDYVGDQTVTVSGNVSVKTYATEVAEPQE